MNKKSDLLQVLIIGFTFFSMVFISCSRSKFDIDIKQPVSVEVVRLDSAIFEPESAYILAHIQDFYTKYPDFFDVYTSRILRVGGLESRYFMEYFKLFLANPDIQESYDSVKILYNDFSKQKKEIDVAFSYLKTYFPELVVPKIYTLISGFNESIVMTDSAIGVSLDKFLGSESSFYQRLAIPRYTRKRLDNDLIAVEIVRNWVSSEFLNTDSVKNLVSAMISNGKVLYLMDAAFPTSTDFQKISYIQSEINWAKKNEKYMWAFLIEKKLLFSTDEREIRKYIDDAPFVSTFGENCPGRIGAWIGWQIVRSYMDRNPEVTINQLFKNRDNQQILIESGYSPN